MKPKVKAKVDNFGPVQQQVMGPDGVLEDFKKGGKKEPPIEVQ